MSEKNVALKMAMFTQQRSQRSVGQAAGIVETRMSEIVGGRGVPVKPEEKRAIAQALGRSVRALFPSAPRRRAARDSAA